MKNQTSAMTLNAKNTSELNVRQLCFFLAFFLPCAKLLELPTLLARYAGGDLLLPALSGLINEFFSFFSLFIVAKKLKKSIFSYISERFGDGFARTLYALYAAFFIFFSVIPLLDMEKFSHAAFSDTSPTFFAFTPFFIFSAFACTKGIKAVGRSVDLTPVLFLVPFMGLMIMAVGQADFSSLLPLFEKPVFESLKATYKVLPHFSGGALLFPLVGGAYEYKEGDGKRLLPAYGFGALLTLFFIATFYSVYGPLAAKEHYAVSKIAQYFPALSVVGRIDLLLVYMLTVVLAFYTALPLQLAVDCFSKATNIAEKTLPTLILNVLAFLFVLFFNRYYDTIYPFFSVTLFPVYVIFAIVLPQAAPLLLFTKKKKDGSRYEKKEKKSLKKEAKNAR